MKRLLAILFVSVIFFPGLCQAQEQADNQPVKEDAAAKPVQRPVRIPTIFDEKKQTACPIEEPCEKAVEEPTEVKKKNKKNFPDILQFFKIDWGTSKSVKKVNIEKYLNLTNEQIEAAKKNRLDGDEKMKPYLEEIKIREKKIENIEFYNVPGEARDEQVKRYYLEIKEIDKEADKIREENQANFEKLLTPEQLKLFREITKPEEDGTAPAEEQL